MCAVGRKQEAVEAFERANEKDPMNVQVRMADAVHACTALHPGMTTVHDQSHASVPQLT